MNNRETPSVVILASQGHEITRGEFCGQIRSLQHTLSQLPSIGERTHGDFKKMAIVAENSMEWMVAFYAGLGSDFVVVPIDHMASQKELAYILNDCRPDVVVVSDKTAKAYADAALELDYQPNEINVNRIARTFEDGALTDTLADINAKFRADNDANALIIYTSGTTGASKGVVLSYANVFANVDAVCREVPIFTSDRPVLALLPFHHIFPLMGSIVAPMYVGARVALSPSLIGPDIIQTLKDNHVAIMIGVPRLYAQIFRGIKDKINLSIIARGLYWMASKMGHRRLSRMIFNSVHARLGGNVHYLISGGAALDHEVGMGLTNLGFLILEGYGMSEAAPMITFPRPAHVKLKTVGQKLPSVEIKIESGEILVRGKNVMKEYYRKPEETREAFDDGWLKTGDLGEFDDEGFLTIKGRSKELIILSNGKNISPAEMEMKLDAISLKENLPIQELAVTTKHDFLHAIIVTRAPMDKELKQLIWEKLFAIYNDMEPSYKQVRSFQLTHDPLPRTRLEKLKRHELKTMLVETAATGTKTPMASFRELEFVQTFIEKEIGSSIDVNSSFSGEIPIDSLSRVELFAAIESNFNVKMTESDLATYNTPKEMADYIRKHAVVKQATEINWKHILSEKINLNLPKTWPTFNLFKNFTHPLFKLYFRMKSSGRDNIPTSGPCIFAANHESFLDGLLVSFYLKNRIMKDTYFYATSEHVRGVLLRFLAATNNIIVVNKDFHLKSSIQKLAKALSQKKNIVIFPEGTRTVDGKLGDLKKTFAILSKELNIPIVPVKITGAYQALPYGKLIPRPFTKIRIEFKKPIWPSATDTYQTIVNATTECLD